MVMESARNVIVAFQSRSDINVCRDAWVVGPDRAASIWLEERNRRRTAVVFLSAKL